MLAWFALSAVAWAESPSLVNIGVDAKGKTVVMHARLVDGFTDSIQEAIESGVAMTFTYQIELREESAVLRDSLISSNTVHHTIKYDSLKKVYRFSEFGRGVKRRIITRNKENYQKMMLTLENIPIASIRRLDPSERYYIRVKADIETDRLWFPFNYLFFFLPFNDFNASWAESSPLSIDPDITLAREEFDGDTQRQSKKASKSVNSVVRSFNK
jgi:hypothetical protein